MFRITLTLLPSPLLYAISFSWPRKAFQCTQLLCLNWAITFLLTNQKKSPRRLQCMRQWRSIHKQAYLFLFLHYLYHKTKKDLLEVKINNLFVKMLNLHKYH